jgi:transposase-like protein
MEQGHLKSKRLSYTAKFKREVIRCAEENGNRKAAAISGVDESNVRLWRKHKAAISGCEASRRKFTGPNYYIIIINNKIIDYCIVLTARTAAQSFFKIQL